VDPGTRTPNIKLARVTMSWIKGAVLLLRSFIRSVPLGNRYYRNAHPAVKPAGIDDYLTAMQLAPDGERLFREGARWLGMR